MAAPLALYRRYRPDTFADVIGQEHVTVPLMAALAADRVSHAYLFSGPRGCGKTTSARILARCLNCERGPTPTPCGECTSCRDLARGGPGSIDVIEIDAASHGGVDDARELRERAFFTPVAARYKVYIVDEAHMVTTQGFNALLKLVEEPPEHLKFVFATTEPDKVIGTIRSRTHHYPFRLVSPKVLTGYLERLCETEGVAIGPGVLPLVVRAGGGSVRDTLSVLDQLIAGAGSDGVTYPMASALLGYTPETLLFDVVDALAAGDGAQVFGAVDRVVESGQDPRRFAEDLLARLRDLVILAAVPDAASAGLVDGTPDQVARLRDQAGRFGQAELTRAAEVVDEGLTSMRGATAPRLHLELLCARLLLPASDASPRGWHARLDRLERRLGIAGSAGGDDVADGADGPAAAGTEPPPPARPATAPVSGPAGEGAGAPARRSATRRAAGTDQPADQPVASVAAAAPPAGQPGTRAAEPARAAAPAVAAAAGGPGGPGAAADLGLADARRLWPDVLDQVKAIRRYSWVLLSQNAQLVGLHAGTLTLAVVNVGAREAFQHSGSEDVLRQALRAAIGVDWRIETVVDAAATPPGGRGGPAPRGAAESWAGAGGDQRDAAADAPTTPAPRRRTSRRSAPAHPADGIDTAAPATAGPATPGPARRRPGDAVDPDDAVDPEADTTLAAIDHTELLARELGAEVVEEYDEPDAGPAATGTA